MTMPLIRAHYLLVFKQYKTDTKKTLIDCVVIYELLTGSNTIVALKTGTKCAFNNKKSKIKQNLHSSNNCLTGTDFLFQPLLNLIYPIGKAKLSDAKKTPLNKSDG